MKYWNYSDEIKNGIVLDINETYYCVDKSGKFVLFKLDKNCIINEFTGEVVETKIILLESLIDSAFYISNMNMENNTYLDESYNFGDINTYPFQIGINKGISLCERSWRIATSTEKIILNKSLELGRPLNLDEIRDLKLKELGI
jgi:hypothetical protein